MFTLVSNGGHEDRGQKSYICDTVDDIQNLPTNVDQGCTAFIITGSKVYMLNGQKEWVEI